MRRFSEFNTPAGGLISIDLDAIVAVQHIQYGDTVGSGIFLPGRLEAIVVSESRAEVLARINTSEG